MIGTLGFVDGAQVSVAAQKFLNRASGVDIAHGEAYKAFLNTLTTNGLFNADGTTPFFDVLYLFATQNSATAILNLVSSSFAATLNGSPTFTTDRGFTGVDGSTTVFLNT